MNQLDEIMIYFPGAIVFFMVTLVALVLSFFSRPKTQSPQKTINSKRFKVGLAILLGLTFLQFIFNLVSWIISYENFRILSITDRLFIMLSLVCLVWMFLSVTSRHLPNILAGITGFLAVVTFVISLIMHIFFSATNLFFTAWVNSIWWIIGFLGCSAMFIYLVMRQKPRSLPTLLLFAIAAFGFLAQIFLPSDQILPAYIRLSQLLYYPILILIASQVGSSSTATSYENSAPAIQSKLDLTPRVAAALMETSLQGSGKKLLNSLTHGLSLLAMADICGIVKVDKDSATLDFSSIYDLFREDYINDFSLPFTQLPEISSALLDQKQLILESEKSRDIDELMQATAYNQVGTVTVFPLKYNGRQVDSGLIFMSPYTMRSCKPETLNGLAKISPTILQVLDHAKAIEENRDAFDSQLISLNKVNREKETIQDQLDHAQALLTELRGEFSASKSNHQKEIQLWIERQQNLERQNQELQVLVEKSRSAINDLATLTAQKDHLEKRLAESSLKINSLQSALLKTKAMIDETVASGEESGFITPDGTTSGEQQERSAEVSISGTNPGEVRLSTIVEKEVNAVMDLCVSKNVKLELHFNGNQASSVTKPEDLGEIVRHLLENAVKISPVGQKVILDLTTSTDNDLKQLLTLQVTDFGGGISPAEQAAYFSMIDRQGQPIPGGVGDAAGLRKMVHLIKEVQGKLWVRSGIDKPTTYKIDLPVINGSAMIDQGSNS